VTLTDMAVGSGWSGEPGPVASAARKVLCCKVDLDDGSLIKEAMQDVGRACRVARR
jgi:hypothetical protein